jgi:hypothetical protein
MNIIAIIDFSVLPIRWGRSWFVLNHPHIFINTGKFLYFLCYSCSPHKSIIFIVLINLPRTWKSCLGSSTTTPSLISNILIAAAYKGSFIELLLLLKLISNVDYLVFILSMRISNRVLKLIETCIGRTTSIVVVRLHITGYANGGWSVHLFFGFFYLKRLRVLGNNFYFLPL